MEKSKSHVIVTGAGDRAFSAGGDITEMMKGPFERSKELGRLTMLNAELVASYKIPFIAIMDGLVLGGASPFSIVGKYRIATERTIYAMPETALGFFNDAGASFFLPRVRMNIGIYMGLTGTRLSGFDLKKVGLATHFIESKRLDDLKKALIACKTDDEIGKSISKHSSVPVSTETDIDAAIPEIDKCFDGDTVDEIYENLHLDGSDWAMETIRTLNKMSPTSLKVSLRSMKEGKNLPLRECLKMEFLLTIHHFLDSDLKEGVRAVLIDKDNKPKWNPAKLADVSPEHVDKFFKPSPDGDELTFEER